MGSLNIASAHSAHPEQRKIYQLQDTIQRMQDEIDHLKEALASVSRTAPRWVTDWGLTMPEATILGALVKHRVVSRDALMAALYSGRGPDAEPDPEIVNVFILRLRRKLRPHGITITTLRGRGWHLCEEGRRRLASSNGSAP